MTTDIQLALILITAVTSPVSLLDITPTILDWLQLPLPSYSIFRSAVIGQQKRTLILVIDGV